MSKDKKKVIQLKDFLDKTETEIEGKVVVGSDIAPQKAVELAIENTPVQVVTNGFDENRILKIKENIQSFLDNPSECLIEMEGDNLLRFEYEFFAQTSKTDFLSLLKDFLKSSHFRRVRDDLVLIADELFTNFAKSAPDDKESMKFAIDSNDENVVIYCRDHFGRLTPKDMLENVQRCFDKGVKEAIKTDSDGGAGIGSYLIYTLGVGMVISVVPGKGSLVLVWMPRKAHHADRIEMNKSLIIIDKAEES